MSDYYAWLAKVNEEIEKICGMSLDDLPDCCYGQWWDEKVSPKRAAKRAVKYAQEN